MSRQQAVEQEDPHFRSLSVDVLTRDNLIRLGVGAIGAIRVQQYLSEAECDSLTATLDTIEMTTYSSARYPLRAARVGPVLNEFNNDGQLDARYWSAAEKAERDWGHSGDLARLSLLDRLRKVWNGPVDVARINGRPAHWCIAREINEGTLLHWDEAALEYFHGLFDQVPVVQLAMNLFIAVPEAGGETRIWRRRWTPSDEDHRHAFGYVDGLVDSYPRVTQRVARGQALVFDSRNYHQVMPGEKGRRLALAYFVGICANGALMVWS